MPVSSFISSFFIKQNSSKLEVAKHEAAELEDTNLEAAKLEDTKLKAAKLEDTKLKVAKFEDTKLKAANHLSKKKLKLMCRDERGILEPQTEILSTALAVIGFVVLAALLSQAYLGYEARAFALENYESASLLADTLVTAPGLRSDSSNMLSASSLDILSSPEGIKQRENIFASFSGNYLFFFEVQTQDDLRHWQIEPVNIEPDSFTEGKEKVAASVPVVIELNPAESVPGTLTVTVCKTPWN